MAWPSHMQLNLWARVTGPRFAGGVAGNALYAAESGVEARMPYADVRLIEHVLTIPWEQRLPAGHLRRTGRDALGGLLPAAFRTRIGQGSWSEIWERNAQAASGLITHILEEGPWLSAPFVNRALATEILHRAVGQGPDVEQRRWTLLLDFATVESWLRRLICYNPPREVDKTWQRL
jgi:hypothetical protein